MKGPSWIPIPTRVISWLWINLASLLLIESLPSFPRYTPWFLSKMTSSYFLPKLTRVINLRFTTLYFLRLNFVFIGEITFKSFLSVFFCFFLGGGSNLRGKFYLTNDLLKSFLVYKYMYINIKTNKCI